MDFGLSSFLEKFEEALGKRWLKVLLCILGLAAASLGVSIIGTNVIQPAYLLFVQLVDPDKTVEIRQAVNTVFTMVLFVGIVSMLVSSYGIRTELKETQKYRDDYEEYMKFVADFYASSDAFFANILGMQLDLSSRLTKSKRNEINESLQEMNEAISDARVELGRKVDQLNSVVAGEAIDQADDPEIADYDEALIRRSPEGEGL